VKRALIVALALAAVGCGPRPPERVKDPTRKAVVSGVLIGYKSDRPNCTAATRSKEEALALAEKLRTDLVAGTITFEEALAHSDDPVTRGRGGLMDRYRFGQLPLKIEAVVLALQPGGISEPYDAGNGYSLFRVDAEDPRGLNHILVSYKGARHAPLAVTRTKDQARETAEQALADLEAGVPFDEAARKYSNGMEAKRGGYLGPALIRALLPEHQQAVDALQAGGRTEVLESPVGFHIYQAVDPWPDTVGLRHVMVAYQGALLAPFSITRSKEEARRRAGEARQKLLDGTDFAVVAKAFSDDASTASKGGDLGPVPLNELPAELEWTAFHLSPGQVSEVVESPGGFHVMVRTR
jgi:parvulin-like peptidyl-prolyl isomerase